MRLLYVLDADKELYQFDLVHSKRLKAVIKYISKKFIVHI